MAVGHIVQSMTQLAIPCDGSQSLPRYLVVNVGPCSTEEYTTTVSQCTFHLMHFVYEYHSPLEDNMVEEAFSRAPRAAFRELTPAERCPWWMHLLCAQMPRLMAVLALLTVMFVTLAMLSYYEIIYGP